MEKEEEERGYYYRAIARHLILRRGAPFLLSPREIDLIARWEAASIPLPVVLEGIDRSVERMKKKKRFLASFSLLLCDGEVQRAYAQHRERLVGGSRRIQVKEKHNEILKAVEKFLAELPTSLTSLKPIFLQALEAIRLEDKGAREKQLEDLEEALEEKLVEAASEEERQEVRAWIDREFPGVTGPEKEEIFKTALIKFMGEKYRVPHLLTCYY
jgi:hypothetical protein